MNTENVRPIVAHVDPRGEPLDWMFDAVLINEIYLYHDNGHPPQEIIEGYDDDLFGSGHPIEILAGAVARLQEELGDPGYRLKIYLDAPWLDGHDVTGSSTSWSTPGRPPASTASSSWSASTTATRRTRATPAGPPASPPPPTPPTASS